VKDIGELLDDLGIGWSDVIFEQEMGLQQKLRHEEEVEKKQGEKDELLSIDKDIFY
jgi:hypothetical protein